MKQREHLMIGQILLDEKAARKAAQVLGLPLTGFPGVVGRAGLDGLLTRHEIRQLLKACQQQGIHYSNALIEAVAQRYGR
jgi:predicted nucleic acid-binding protein